MQTLEGLFTALVTPFDADGEVDWAALPEIMEWQLARGVSGFYLCGSTGEAPLLSPEERMRLVESAVANAKGRVPMVAQIGCQRTEDTIRLAKHARSCGVDAVSALPPIYFKYSQDEIARFYLDIVEAVPMPLIVYNIPSLSGVAFDSENSEVLFAHPNIVGMKCTTTDLFQVQRMMTKHPEKVFINGFDEIFLNTLPFGIRMAIGSSFNYMPEKFLAIRAHFDAGEMDQAMAVQGEVNRILDVLRAIGFFRGVKGMMRLLGLPGGDCRKPFAPLSNAELDRLREVARLL